MKNLNTYINESYQFKLTRNYKKPKTLPYININYDISNRNTLLDKIAFYCYNNCYNSYSKIGTILLADIWDALDNNNIKSKVEFGELNSDDSKLVYEIFNILKENTNYNYCKQLYENIITNDFNVLIYKIESRCIILIINKDNIQLYISEEL